MDKDRPPVVSRLWRKALPSRSHLRLEWMWLQGETFGDQSGQTAPGLLGGMEGVAVFGVSVVSLCLVLFVLLKSALIVCLKTRQRDSNKTLGNCVEIGKMETWTKTSNQGSTQVSGLLSKHRVRTRLPCVKRWLGSLALVNLKGWCLSS